MSKKIPLGVSLTAILVAIALTAAVTVVSYKKIYNSMIEDLPQRTEQYMLMSEIEDIVRTEYCGKPDYQQLKQSIAQGYVSGLNDSRSFYIAPENSKAYNDYLNGKISGCGITAKFDAENTCLKVISVEENSSAAASGIVPDTLIYSVDGVNVSESNSFNLIQKLNGEAGDVIRVGIMTFGEESSIQRNVISVKNGYTDISCTCSLNGKVGYIRLSSFYSDTVEQFSEALQKLLDQGAESLIFDVRDNAGVDYASAVSVIDRIVPLAVEGTGAIATAVNASGETVQIFSADSEALNLPIAVLINGKTEGAAELLACDFRDFGKARLFGEKTAGIGTMQKMFTLDNGGAVVLSVAEILPYKSESYDGIGITPDEIVDIDASGTQTGNGLNGDAQYLAAYAYLSR